jgi:serine/threonine protein kinase
MIGTTVGKYRILTRLGRGGMGTVYRAVDETLDREVAIKVLNSEVSDAKLMARFRAEATMLARLNHPEIATIFEIVKTDTDLMMVMELVRGETFDQLSIRSGPLAPERAAYLVAQVLNGLAYAHRAGIVHRDLKPANVMVTDSGTVKIMDFGIARVLGAEHLTTDGTMMGTPAYMAPEQVLGKEVDARADLYSAGVVFYRLLTGCLPFQADTPIGMVQKQLWEPPTPVHSYRSDLPEWCETVMTRALAKAPEDRFQSAEEFRSALLSVMGHSTKSMALHSSSTFPAIGASTPPPVVATPPPVAFTPPQTPRPSTTPSRALTAADLAAAPTVTLVRTPTAHDLVAANTVDSAAASAGQPDVVSSSAVDTSAPSSALANTVLATQSGAPTGVPAAPALDALPAAVATPAPVPPPSVKTAAAPRKPGGAAPASQANTRYLLGAAAVLAILAVGIGVMWRSSRGAPSVAPVSQTATAQPAPVDPPADAAPPAESPAASAAVVDASANATTSADAPNTTPATANGVPVGTDGPNGASRPARPAASPRPAPKAEVPAPAPPAEPPPTTATGFTPPPATVDTPETTVPAGAAALPPFLFSAQTVMVESGKNRQRDTNVELANGTVTVKDKENKLVTTLSYQDVVGFTYSNSKQPLWNTPHGPAEIVHLDGGAFGFFKGDQHWVSLRTDKMSLVLRLRDQDTRRVIAAFEERFGKPVERVSDK